MVGVICRSSEVVKTNGKSVSPLKNSAAPGVRFIAACWCCVNFFLAFAYSFFLSLLSFAFKGRWVSMVSLSKWMKAPARE